MNWKANFSKINMHESEDPEKGDLGKKEAVKK
jgi:hypothetical protein